VAWVKHENQCVFWGRDFTFFPTWKICFWLIQMIFQNKNGLSFLIFWKKLKLLK
jgi:hypothetical protein